MKKSHLLAFLLALTAFGAGCSPRPVPVGRTATPTWGLPTPTETSPVQTPWLVHTMAIQDWPPYPYHISWTGDLSFRVSDPGRTEFAVHPNTLSEVQTLPPLARYHGLPAEDLFYSPEDTFVIAREEGVVSLVRVADEEILGQIEVADLGESPEMSWLPDESAVAFVSFSRQGRGSFTVYIWETSLSQPSAVAQLSEMFPTSAPSWSPDRQKLAIATSAQTGSASDISSYILVYADGRPPTIVHTWILKNEGRGVKWLTDNIVYTEFYLGCTHYYYFIADTGVELSDVNPGPCSFWGPQKVQLSPDQRWLVVDRLSLEIVPANDSVIPGWHSYTLYDLVGGNTYPLSDSHNTVLEFMGWSGETGKFYVVQHPLYLDLPETSPLPNGLLALDPLTRQFQLLNSELTYAWPSPSMRRFFGLRADGNGDRSTAFYDANGRRLTAPVSIVSPATPYDLGPHSYVPPAGRIMLAWANGEDQVAYRDTANDLWLSRLDGSTVQLGSRVPEWDGYLDWSPDDSLLFVEIGGQAWGLLPPLRPGQAITLANIAMVDAAQGWGQTASGHLVRITNGGATWQDVTPLDNAVFYFKDAWFAWASRSGEGSTLDWQTTDGGRTWQVSDMPVQQAVQTLRTFPAFEAPFFLDEQIGWQVLDGQLQRTTDGGLTWEEITPTVIP